MIRALAWLAVLALAGCGGPRQDGAGAGNAAARNPSNATANAAPPEPVRRSYDPPVPRHLPDIVRMRIETEAGTIVVALDHRRAPITTTNFVRYADDHRFDGTFFYRAARNRFAADQGFIQGGIAHSVRLMLPPIKLEPTNKTGLKHVDGTISMAHSSPDTTMGDFILCVGVHPGLDADPAKREPGYPAFGRVVEGMDVVRRILAAPTAGGAGGRPGEQILRPVKIVRVSRAA
jgi:peptidyl-prolyl cis-trans isomerase A (cyclophilin A)